jgi:hypothetical protein
VNQKTPRAQQSTALGILYAWAKYANRIFKLLLFGSNLDTCLTSSKKCRSRFYFLISTFLG